MTAVPLAERTRGAMRASTARRALTLHRFVFRFALAGANVFAWIFIFQYFSVISPDPGHAFARTALLYALSQTITSLVTPYAARSLGHGTRRSLITATLVAALAFALLGLSFTGFWGPLYTVWGVTGFALLLGSYRALYWVPYETEAHDTGKQTPALKSELLIAFVPLVVGLVLAGNVSAPIWLLYSGALFIVLSTIPLRRLHEVRERFSWSYRETFAELVSPENRVIVLRSFFEGVVGAALLFLWPIAIFLIVGWSYGVLGLIISISLLAAVLLRDVIRTFFRRVRISESGLLNSVLIVSPWIFRLAVATPLGIVLVDSYFYATTPKRLGMDSAVFDQAGDGGSFIDEYTALKEIGLALGKIAMCAFAAWLALLVSLPIAFIGAFLVAALASMLAVL